MKSQQATMDETLYNLDLVTLQGDIIVIEYPESIADEFIEDFCENQQCRGYWKVGNWIDARAIYRGHRLDSIDMAQIIGTR